MKLLKCVLIIIIVLQVMLCLPVGESGLVYRGYINSGELVAVKTGKGNNNNKGDHNSILH